MGVFGCKLGMLGCVDRGVDGGVWVYTRYVRVCGWGCLGVLGEVRVYMVKLGLFN